MVAAVFLSIHKNCITILMHFYINLFLMHSFFKRKWYFIMICIIILMHFFYILHHLSDAFFSFPLKQAGVSDLFLHHLCDSFLLDFASLLWCISSYFNENTTHLADSLYLLLHHIFDASFSFKVNRGCYFIILLMQFYL